MKTCSSSLCVLGACAILVLGSACADPDALVFTSVPEVSAARAALTYDEGSTTPCADWARVEPTFQPIDGAYLSTLTNASSSICREASSFYASTDNVYVFDGGSNHLGLWCTLDDGSAAVALSTWLFGSGNLDALKATMGHEVLHTLVGTPPSTLTGGGHDQVFDSWAGACAQTTGCVDQSTWSSQYGLSWDCTPPPEEDVGSTGGGGGDETEDGYYECGYDGPCYEGQLVSEIECEGWCGGEWDAYAGACYGKITCEYIRLD